MKKCAKVKSSIKKAKAGKNELPDLVAVMAKFVERLEAMEKKIDLLAGRVASLPSEVSRLVPSGRSPMPQQAHSGHGPKPDQSAPREKVLYEAICADCCKNCKVPFKPSEGRPVYCPECFAIRKAGHVPKDITGRIKVPQFPKPVPATPQKIEKNTSSKRSAPVKKKRQKPVKKSKK